jgi:MFS family permease
MPWFFLLGAVLCIDLAGNLPIGSLPLALVHEGASASTVSLVMATGMIAALVGSVPLGFVVDRFGRLATMRISIGVLAASMVALAYARGPLESSIVMALRSLAFIAAFTAQFAYASEIVGEERRVSAVTTLGIIGNLSMAFSPACAVWLWQHGIGREQYAWAAILVGIALFVMLPLPAVHDVRTPRRSRTILMRSAWIPAIAFSIGLTIQGGVNGSLAILTFHQRGIANAALLFTVQSITVFLLRYPIGRLVDTLGPRAVALPTVLFQAAGCVAAAFAWTPLGVTVAGIGLGVAWAAVVPIGIALFFEKSSRTTRGTAMGAYNFALSLGAASGALIAAICAAFGPGYPLAILLAATAPIAALPYVLRSGGSKLSLSAPQLVTKKARA